MKKILSYSLVLFTVLAVSSCGKLAKKAAKSVMGQVEAESVELNLLNQPQELKQWYDTITEKLGEGASVTDEISLSVTKLQDNQGELFISLVCQSNENKHNVIQTLYSSSANGWQAPITKEIEIIGGNEEEFNLEDELFDLKLVMPIFRR